MRNDPFKLNDKGSFLFHSQMREMEAYKKDSERDEASERICVYVCVCVSE